MEYNDIVYSDMDEINKIKLNTKNEGFNKFFKDFIDEMTKLEFYCIKFFSKRDAIYDAFFSNIGGIGVLALPKKFLECKEIDSYGLSIILHEMSHYKHLMMSGGEFMTPRLFENKSVSFTDYENIQDRYNIEYEAYYRSLYYNSIYNMNLRDDIVYANKKNLFNVLNMNGLTTRPYNEDERKKILENVVPNDLIYTGTKLNLDNKLTR
jgi:hypothetical protein